MRESEQQFEQLFEASPDAIVLIDPHDPSASWPILDCNEAACKMNGYTRDELIGESIGSPRTPDLRRPKTPGSSTTTLCTSTPNPWWSRWTG
jgi:PAS domain S-box-containing protein